MPRGNQRWWNPSAELSRKETEDDYQFKCLAKNEVFDWCSHIFFWINWDQSQGGQRKHLSTVGNRGLALLPKILSLELYSKKREKRESIHPNSVKGKAITFDQAELNFNPSCTSQSFPVISGQLSHQFKTWLYHWNKYLVHWRVGRIMLNELTDAEMIRHHGHYMVGTGWLLGPCLPSFFIHSFSTFPSPRRKWEVAWG